MYQIKHWSNKPSLNHPRAVTALILAGMALMLVNALNAASPRVVITPAVGFTITWDGNNGGFSSADVGAGPSNNVALASNGTTPFTSSDLGPVLSIPFHRAVNLNDGLYGNAHSWISANGVGGTSDPDPFAGLSFSAAVNVSSIAWSRDNGDSSSEGTFVDRTVGTYTLQFTTVPAPDATTVDTGDSSTGWQTIGTLQYLTGTENAAFTSYLRHRFDLRQAGGPINASGLRIKVSDGNTDLDEIEVNPIPDPIPPISDFVDITPAPGFNILFDSNEGKYSTPATPARAPENDASVSRGAVAFGSSELNFGVHFIHNVNDGFYGNTHSWIPDFAANPDPAPFIGIRFGHKIDLRSLAWGRDNGDVAGDCCGGTLTDRALGLYTIQVTTAANPGTSTPEACGPYPESGWVTIGTIDYRANNPTYFNSYLRHRFDLSATSGAIQATGIRIKVPNNNSDIDEIEVNSNLAIEQNSLSISNAPGFNLVWDGNDGQFNNSAAGAAPPANQALATAGTIPFTSSDLGPVLAIPFHRAVNLNDGLYGNAHSWISANGVGGATDPDPFAGLNFGGSINVTNISWGRDNGDTGEGTFTDRAIGSYRLQYTTVSSPDATTADTGDASTGWQDVGTVTYIAANPPFLTPYLRHRFDLSAGGAPIEATGIRIKVSNGQMDIDEIEINSPASVPAPPPLVITPAAGYSITWDGNNGQFNDPSAGAAPPANEALATVGTIPFTSSDLGPVLSIPYHRALNLNDGLYGNGHSWISANGVGGTSDSSPFAGLNFGAFISITNIAWSRDNGDLTEGGCTAGTCVDRALGTYTLQVTTVPAPDGTTVETEDSSTGWATVGTLEYRGDQAGFTSYLRHRFDLSAGGAPIDATGIRIKVSNGQMDIDEIEVNTLAAVPAPRLNIVHEGNVVRVSWTGGGLETAPNVTGPWTCLGFAASPFELPLNAETPVFFRARR